MCNVRKLFMSWKDNKQKLRQSNFVKSPSFNLVKKQSLKR